MVVAARFISWRSILAVGLGGLGNISTQRRQVTRSEGERCLPQVDTLFLLTWNKAINHHRLLNS